MDADEEKVKSYLEGCGFKADRFTKTETLAGKTPDFRVFQNGNFQFYCEVKAIPKDRWLAEQLNNAGPCELAGGARNDPIFNRLTTDIHTAVKQFDSVNLDQMHPNVLAFLNHDGMCRFNDLLGILTGNFFSDNGAVHPIYKQFSHGRIKDEKLKVHLYIWLDAHKPNRLLFNQTNANHCARLCALFGIKQNEIEQIPS